ncbi:hypothetical protein F2P79_023087 [Pimephales promelas]|nr:hypothetical protein F2P79_023087 [Pimephales promelas]
MRGSIADRVTRQLDTLQDTAVLGAGPGITPKHHHDGSRGQLKGLGFGRDAAWADRLKELCGKSLLWRRKYIYDAISTPQNSPSSCRNEYIFV